MFVNDVDDYRFRHNGRFSKLDEIVMNMFRICQKKTDDIVGF
jgi:hypothetical protein